MTISKTLLNLVGNVALNGSCKNSWVGRDPFFQTRAEVAVENVADILLVGI
jgi:hypothetical protein